MSTHVISSILNIATSAGQELREVSMWTHPYQYHYKTITSEIGAVYLNFTCIIHYTQLSISKF